MRHLASLLALCAFLGASSAASQAATTWFVAKDGTGDFTTIHDALAAASEGDTIQIGPGRYEETRQMTTPGGTFDVYGGITANRLTIIGAGATEVIIGPSTANFQNQGPIGFLSIMDDLVVRELSIQNTFCSIAHDGRLDVIDCAFRVFEDAIDTSPTAAGTALVRGCSFSGGIDRAIQITDLFGLGTSSILIEQCTFTNNGFGFDSQLRGTTVQDCQFIDNFVGVQFSFGASGTIQRCTFTDTQRAIGIVSGSSAELIDNTITGGEMNLASWSFSAVTGTGNTFGGGTGSTMRFLAGGGATLHGNHILRVGNAPYITIVTTTPDLYDIDLTGNYWGTNNAQEIADGIQDSQDGPQIAATVLFEPFIGQPIAIEPTSFGEIKARYGPSQE